MKKMRPRLSDHKQSIKYLCDSIVWNPANAFMNCLSTALNSTILSPSKIRLKIIITVYIERQHQRADITSVVIKKFFPPEVKFSSKCSFRLLTGQKFPFNARSPHI